MDQLLASPEIQAGIIPFIVAVLWAFALRPVGWYWSGMALILGFAACVHLINFVPGWELIPFTSSSRKLIAVALAAPLLGILFDTLSFLGRARIALAALAGGAAVVWVFWSIFKQQEGIKLIEFVAASALFVAWFAGSFATLHERGLRASGAAVALGFGVGLSALLGASAAYGQMGIAIGAAAGGVWLVGLPSRAARIGAVMLLPAAVIGGMLAVGAVLLAKVPWWSLLPLLAIPVVAHMPLPRSLPRWLDGGIATVVMLAIAGTSVYFVYRVEGGVPL